MSDGAVGAARRRRRGAVGRSYAADGEVVFEVRDEFCPWNEGRWRVAGGARGANRRAAGPARWTSSALGSAYLGGITFRQLRRRAAGVEELTAGAVARADALFATDCSVVPRDLLTASARLRSDQGG